MTYCESCQCHEGKTKYVEVEGVEVLRCAECDSEEELILVPEHDDYDMER